MSDLAPISIHLLGEGQTFQCYAELVKKNNLASRQTLFEWYAHNYTLEGCETVESVTEKFEQLLLASEFWLEHDIYFEPHPKTVTGSEVESWGECIYLGRPEDTRVYAEMDLNNITKAVRVQWRTTKVVDSADPGKTTLTVDVYSDNATFRDAIKDLFFDVTTVIPKDETNRVSLLLSDNGSLYLQSVDAKSAPLVPDNYTPELVTAFGDIQDNLKAKDPPGRLTILEGKPGTGKTHFIRSLVSDTLGVDFVLIASNMIVELASPSLLPVLLNHAKERHRPIVLILEDADNALLERSADNVATVSALLNMADGILGTLLNVHIIATSNSAHAQMDQAITRSGRLFRYLKTPLLNREHAIRVYNRLTKSERGTEWCAANYAQLVEGISLAEVYAATATTAVKQEMPTGRKVGF